MAKRITKTIVVSKHIHSCFAGWSSNDKWVIVITNSKDIDFEPVVGTTISSNKLPMLNGEMVQEIEGDKEFMTIYVDADKTFYNRALRHQRVFGNDYSKTDEFKDVVQSYLDKGFVIDKDITAQKDYWKRQEEKSSKKAKKKGVVLWMDYDAYHGHPEYYQGGFSDEVFKSKELYDYIKRGSVFGWIGHRGGRTFESDRQIEAGLRKRGISTSKMHNWICSSDGRHYGDSLEGCTKKERKASISKYLNGIYNKCIIYGAPEHKGTLDSSISIEDTFKELNILLPYGEKYNHQKHIENLLKAKEMLISKKDLTEQEKYVNDMLNEIFANKV
jgi:hypothetical protein